MHSDMGAWRVRSPRDPENGEPGSCVEAVWAEITRTETDVADPLIPEQPGGTPFRLGALDEPGESAQDPDGAGDECWAGSIKGDPGFFDADLWGVALPVAGEREH